MNSRLFKTELEYKTWDDCYKRYEVNGELPLSYPCIVSYHIDMEPEYHHDRPILYINVVYPEDFNK